MWEWDCETEIIEFEGRYQTLSICSEWVCFISDTPTQFGELLLLNLKSMIENRFPESTIPTPIQKERIVHDKFKALSRIYVGGQNYKRRINENLLKSIYSAQSLKIQQTLILRKSGSGKSSLVSNW